MRFEQVRDVFAHLIDYHQALVSDYRKLSDQADEQRVQLLLRYLADHESRMREGLKRYSEDPLAAKVLNTWMDDAPDLEHPHVLEDLRGRLCCTTLDEITGMAVKIHGVLQDLYRRLAEEAPIRDEREMFEALAGFQEAETRRLVRDTARLDF